MELHRHYLEIAMEEARTAFHRETYPIGAVIVGPDGEIISQGHNHVYDEGDFTSHAEMEAIRVAGDKLMRKEMFGLCTLYTTLEPCLMCCGALLHARIARVIWVKDDKDHGALRWLRDKTHPFSNLYVSDLYVSKFNALEILNAGEILPACEYDDLTGRMDDWLECWNSMKKRVEGMWRQGRPDSKELCLV
jgi:tRNA(adenine34) deaminase